MPAYYNEFDPNAAAWLRELIARGLIAPGEVDERGIADVRPDDLKGFTQCHFFAGIGGWSYALRLALWPDDRPVWTGSCPCQPFSAAGKRKGFDDERHLWPVFRNLIAQCGPATVFGEQVAAAAQWLGLVRGDLEALGYAVGAMPIEAASAGAFHKRDRFWFVGYRPEQSERESHHEGDAIATCGQARAIPIGAGSDSVVVDAVGERGCGRDGQRPNAADAHAPSEGLAWVIGSDGKRRPVKSGVRLLAHGISSRGLLLRGFGNAIDPRPAAAFIKAADEAMTQSLSRPEAA